VEMMQRKAFQILSEATSKETGSVEKLRSAVRAAIETLYNNLDICGLMFHMIAARCFESGEGQRRALSWFEGHEDNWNGMISKIEEDGKLKKGIGVEQASMFVRGAIWMCAIEVAVGKGKGAKESFQRVWDALETTLFNR